MGRILFVGDSHSMGYIDPGTKISDKFFIWQSNNYAELYAKKHNKQAVIMASSGCGNREYVNFLAQAFKLYDDIDEVFVQSTYWGRFPLAVNPDLNEKQIFPLDFFLEKDQTDDLIHRYSVGLVQQERYLQNYTKPKPEDWGIEYHKETSPSLLPNLSTSSYMYIQMYHYLQTHLEQQDYFRNMLLCDTLCERNNAKLHIWNINDRCFIPKETSSFYTDLKVTTIADMPAIPYVKQFSEIDPELCKADSEHYNEYAHNLIAEYYIPYIRNL